MTVLRWATTVVVGLLAVVALAHVIVDVLGPLVPMLVLLVFMMAIFAIALRGR